MHWKELFSFLIRRCQVISSSNITWRENTYTIGIQLETCAGLARAGSASIAAQQTGVTPAEGDIYTKDCSRGDKQKKGEGAHCFYGFFFFFKFGQQIVTWKFGKKMRLELQEKRIQANDIAQEAVEEWVEWRL